MVSIFIKREREPLSKKFEGKKTKKRKFLELNKFKYWLYMDKTHTEMWYIFPENVSC